MRSGYGSLPRARYSRAKRAAIVAASASVLTGTALAMPAASYANEVADAPPITNVDLADSTMEAPESVPLPDAEADTPEPATGVLDLSTPLDTVPETANAAPTATEPGNAERVSTEPVSTEPVTTDPVATQPVVEPIAVEKVTAETVTVQPIVTDALPTAPATDVQSDATHGAAQPSMVQPGPSVPARFDAARPSRGDSAPASAVAATPLPAGQLDAADPVASDAIVGEVLEHRAQREMGRAAPAEAAPVVEAERSAPALTKDGLALAAPLTDTGPRGVDTVDLLTGAGPDSSMGDWNLMPEVLFAIGPLFLAGAAVAAHGRRNARGAAGHVGVVQRGRHASTH